MTTVMDGLGVVVHFLINTETEHACPNNTMELIAEIRRVVSATRARSKGIPGRVRTVARHLISRCATRENFVEG